MNKVYVFGHQKPDTDTVTSSIVLAYLKSKQGLNTEPRILGDINKETQFVLDYFKVKRPHYLDSVKLELKDINYYHDFYINEKDSPSRANNFIAHSDQRICMLSKSIFNISFCFEFFDIKKLGVVPSSCYQFIII